MRLARMDMWLMNPGVSGIGNGNAFQLKLKCVCHLSLFGAAIEALE